MSMSKTAKVIFFKMKDGATTGELRKLVNKLRNMEGVLFCELDYKVNTDGYFLKVDVPFDSNSTGLFSGILETLGGLGTLVDDSSKVLAALGQDDVRQPLRNMTSFTRSAPNTNSAPTNSGKALGDLYFVLERPWEPDDGYATLQPNVVYTLKLYSSAIAEVTREGFETVPVDLKHFLVNPSLIVSNCADIVKEHIIPEPEAWDGELYDADPDCKHTVVNASGGGVKCTKCAGWFCH